MTTEDPPGGRPEDAGRAERAAPSRLDTDEPIENRVAPWRDWTPVTLRPSSGGAYPVHFTVSGLDAEQNARYGELITEAAFKYFEIEKPPPENEGPAAYLVEPGLLRVVYDELIVQFKPHVGWAGGNAILEDLGFRTVGQNCFAKNQWIVRHVQPGVAGKSLLEAADRFAEVEDVEFAWPNSVAEYQRSSDPLPPEQRWWLDTMGVNSPPGVRALDGGKPSVIIAVLDDGIDIDHPNLVSRAVPSLGRDFNFLPSQPDFSDPRPKINQPGEKGDFHGTSCAGVICSDGNETGFLGVAPGCRFVAVRIFAGIGLIGELQVARAITYATGIAGVISCSWWGLEHEAVKTAINGTRFGRGNKGTVFVCSAGNHGKAEVYFPASHARAIAVGAIGPYDEVTWYSHYGAKLDVVAPSSLYGTNVYSTDVSKPGWGFNTGSAPAGLFATVVGKTSAAAAMAAGVAALCLSVNPNLTVAQLRSVLRTKAAKVGIEGNHAVAYTPSGANGRSEKLGSGRIDAAAAVAEAKIMLRP